MTIYQKLPPVEEAEHPAEDDDAVAHHLIGLVFCHHLAVPGSASP